VKADARTKALRAKALLKYREFLYTTLEDRLPACRPAFRDISCILPPPGLNN
jgi:hypothetical protein